MGEPWLGAGTVDHERTLDGGRDCRSWENPGREQGLWIMGEPWLGVSTVHRYVSWLMLKNRIRSRIKAKAMSLDTACRGVEVLPHTLLALALDRVEWSRGTRPGFFTSVEESPVAAE